MAEPRTTRPDPEHAEVTVGWPRPALPTDDGAALPHAWITAVYPRRSGPVQVPSEARLAVEAIEQWRCQVCGEHCGAEVFAPAVPDDCPSWPPVADSAGTVAISGGPLCSLRCVRLALASCPYLSSGDHAVIGFARADTFHRNTLSSATTLRVRRWQVLTAVAA